MYREHRVVAFIPYGRQVTVSILLPYLEREHARGVLDEVMLCMNTDQGQHDDEAYARKLARTHDWINCYERPGPNTPAEQNIPHEWRLGYRVPKQLNTMRFYWYMQDRSTVYLRFDDDIVYVHPEAIKRLVDCELDRPEVLGTFPTIWNNAVCSAILQEHGVMPATWGLVGRHCIDPRGWGDPVFAAMIHNFFLQHLDDDNIEALLRDIDVDLGWREQFSVSCFAVSGGEYADLGGVLDWDEEEHWLTQFRTGVVGKGNVVRMSALVSHFSFYPQRDYLMTKTDLLDRYRWHAERVAEQTELELLKGVDVYVLSKDGSVTKVEGTVGTRPDDAEPGELIAP